VSDALAVRSPVDVIAVPHPFSTKRIAVQVREGATLAEIVAQAGLSPLVDARVFIERAGLVYGPISRDWWPRIRPKRGSRVTIRALPSGGGGGGDSNKTLRLILQIVVIIVAIVITVATYGAGAPIGWAMVAGATVSIIGNLAINMLLPVQPSKLGRLAQLTGTP